MNEDDTKPMDTDEGFKRGELIVPAMASIGTGRSLLKDNSYLLASVGGDLFNLKIDDNVHPIVFDNSPLSVIIEGEYTDLGARDFLSNVESKLLPSDNHYASYPQSRAFEERQREKIRGVIERRRLAKKLARKKNTEPKKVSVKRKKQLAQKQARRITKQAKKK